MEENLKSWTFTPQPPGYRFEDAVNSSFPGFKVKEARLGFKRRPQRNGQRTLMLLVEHFDDEGRLRLNYFFMDEGDRLIHMESTRGLALIKDLSLVV